MTWSGLALAPDGTSARESTIEGALERGRWFEPARIVLDRNFETQGFDGTPFAVESPEQGGERVLSLDSERASLRIAFDPEELGEELRVIESFVPHFFLDSEVPGVSRKMRYTLVCKGGTGRLRAGRAGDDLFGDLAITVACRTYVEGSERDESQIRIRGAFRASRERP